MLWPVDFDDNGTISTDSYVGMRISVIGDVNACHCLSSQAVEMSVERPFFLLVLLKLATTAD
jgi:hypothetical protein